MNIEVSGVKKLIPRKFEEIDGLENYLDDFEHSRLSGTERESLNRILAEQRMKHFIKELKGHRLYGEIIRDAEFVGTFRIVTKKDDYFVIRFDNKAEFRCPRELCSGLGTKIETRLY